MIPLPSRLCRPASCCCLPISTAPGFSSIVRLRSIPITLWAWTRLGFLNVYSGRPADGQACFEQGIRLSPLDPFSFNCFVGLGLASFAAGRPEEAAAWTQRAIDQKPGVHVDVPRPRYLPRACGSTSGGPTRPCKVCRVTARNESAARRGFFGVYGSQPSPALHRRSPYGGPPRLICFRTSAHHARGMPTDGTVIAVLSAPCLANPGLPLSPIRTWFACRGAPQRRLPRRWHRDPLRMRNVAQRHDEQPLRSAPSRCP